MRSLAGMLATVAGTFLVLLTVIAAAVAGAQTVKMWKQSLQAAVINDLAINASRWTGWILVIDKRSVTLEINYTWSAATAVTMRCETTDDASVANDSGWDLQIIEDSATSGTSNSFIHTWSNAVSASEKWSWSVSNLPHDYLNCKFDGTAADGSDKVTVKYKGISP